MTREAIRVVYVTSSDYKVEENKILAKEVQVDGAPVGERFAFDIRRNQIQEQLEVRIDWMVEAEVRAAYEALHVPCIVEHAGLIFSDYEAFSYPGGLTKPMWNTLGERFIEETRSAGRSAIARAVVAYCDGQAIYTFVGETHGHLADGPRGSRSFYWDTVFIPDSDSGNPGKRTYAEIVEQDGLPAKVRTLSQSTKAMMAFLRYRLGKGEPELWPHRLW
jgi:XTP/dITP diphosphohydrolase